MKILIGIVAILIAFPAICLEMSYLFFAKPIWSLDPLLAVGIGLSVGIFMMLCAAGYSISERYK